MSTPEEGHPTPNSGSKEGTVRLNELADRLGVTPKAPRKAGGPLLATGIALNAAASAFIEKALRDGSKSVTAGEVLEGSEVLSSAYVSANAIGDLLGHGRKGLGMGLLREGTGRYAVSQENAYRAVQVLSQEALEKLLGDLGMELNAFAEKLEMLPSEVADNTGNA